MPNLSWRLVLVALLTAFFVYGGLRNLFAPKSIVDEFVRWGYPPWFPFVTGTLELATAALLLFPETRQIGAALGCSVMLAAAGTVVLNGEYAHAIPALVILGLTAFVGWS
jgi:uncharacterized membrane protein